MKKRFLALLLCLCMCLSALSLVGCSDEEDEKDSNDKGAYITMYLSDEITNFDPAYAYNNEEAESIVGLLYARLFKLTEKGKVEGDLATEYEFKNNEKTGEVTMEISIRDAWWSDKTKVTAEDIVYAWKRILNSENSFSCASLLFDLKNARAVKAGNCSIDDLGVCALNDTKLRITFENEIDYDQFLLNLTSLALAPLREDYASKGDDWAKKPGTMVTSGPFKISKTSIFYDDNDKAEGHRYLDKYYMEYDSKTNTYTQTSAMEPMGYFTLLVLERNAYYLRDPDDEDLALDSSVTPYRILVNCVRTDEEILAAFNNNEIFYMGYIPVSLRKDSTLMDKATVSDGMSTQTFYLNEEALLKNATTGEEVALFANADVRRALSLALDRTAIAEELVLAEAATGIIPTGVFNKRTSGSFRKEGGDLISASANTAEAASLLSAAGVKASDYTFTVKYNPNDDQSVVTATKAVEAWAALGFNVTLEARGTIPNNEWSTSIGDTPKDILDDLLLDDMRERDYTVLIADMCMYSADAYGTLAAFALNFSGMVDSDFNTTPHMTGYNSEAYNKLIEAVYYLPYYAKITSADYTSFVGYDTEEEFAAILEDCKAIYEEYEIDTEKSDLSDARTLLLHKAEEILVEDMAVIPVVFLKTAVVGNEDLLKKVTSGDYYTAFGFTKATLKDYETYLEEFEKIYSNK